MTPSNRRGKRSDRNNSISQPKSLRSISVLKVKGKFHPITGHEGLEGE
jgi:hypothetical protein